MIEFKYAVAMITLIILVSIFIGFLSAVHEGYTSRVRHTIRVTFTDRKCYPLPDYECIIDILLPEVVNAIQRGDPILDKYDFISCRWFPSKGKGTRIGTAVPFKYMVHTSLGPIKRYYHVWRHRDGDFDYYKVSEYNYEQVRSRTLV